MGWIFSAFSHGRWYARRNRNSRIRCALWLEQVNVSPALWWAALCVPSFFQLFVLWAMASNRFFATTVRIQDERGHQVVDTGPYRYVRHPRLCSVDGIHTRHPDRPWFMVDVHSRCADSGPSLLFEPSWKIALCKLIFPVTRTIQNAQRIVFFPDYGELCRCCRPLDFAHFTRSR